MDQQKNQPPKAAPSAEEIARLEAEAVAAIQRGETPAQAARAEAVAAMRRGETSAQAGPRAADAEGGRRADAGKAPDFVPYVDDVSEPISEPKAAPKAAEAEGGRRADAGRAPDFVPYVDDVPEPVPEPKAAPRAPEAGDDGDDDGEYVPGKWEQRIDALSPKQWRTAQIIGGAAVGLVAVACLFVFGEELSTYGLIVAALLALLLPRYLERAWRRRLTTARYAMAVAMLAGLAAFALIVGFRTGFRLTK